MQAWRLPVDTKGAPARSQPRTSALTGGSEGDTTTMTARTPPAGSFFIVPASSCSSRSDKAAIRSDTVAAGTPQASSCAVT